MNVKEEAMQYNDLEGLQESFTEYTGSSTEVTHNSSGVETHTTTHHYRTGWQTKGTDDFQSAKYCCGLSVGLCVYMLYCLWAILTGLSTIEPTSSRHVCTNYWPWVWFTDPV